MWISTLYGEFTSTSGTNYHSALIVTARVLALFPGSHRITNPAVQYVCGYIFLKCIPQRVALRNRAVSGDAKKYDASIPVWFQREKET